MATEMQVKTSEFSARVAKYNIRDWRVHTCSMCHYRCGYVFYNNTVSYDNGCNCAIGYVFGDRAERVTVRTWEEVAQYFRSNDRDREFWHFDSDPPELEPVPPPPPKKEVPQYILEGKGCGWYHTNCRLQQVPETLFCEQHLAQVKRGYILHNGNMTTTVPPQDGTQPLGPPCCIQ